MLKSAGREERAGEGVGRANAGVRMKQDIGSSVQRTPGGRGKGGGCCLRALERKFATFGGCGKIFWEIQPYLWSEGKVHAAGSLRNGQTFVVFKWKKHLAWSKLFV